MSRSGPLHGYLDLHVKEDSRLAGETAQITVAHMCGSHPEAPVWSRPESVARWRGSRPQQRTSLANDNRRRVPTGFSAGPRLSYFR